MKRFELKIEDTKIMKFLEKNAENVTLPISCNRIFADYKRKIGTRITSQAICRRFISIIAPNIHKNNELSMVSRVKILFLTSTSIDKNFLKRLRKIAKVDVDREGRIVKYKARKGKFELEGEHRKKHQHQKNNRNVQRKPVKRQANVKRNTEESEEKDEEEEEIHPPSKKRKIISSNAPVQMTVFNQTMAVRSNNDVFSETLEDVDEMMDDEPSGDSQNGSTSISNIIEEREGLVENVDIQFDDMEFEAPNPTLARIASEEQEEQRIHIEDVEFETPPPTLVRIAVEEQEKPRNRIDVEKLSNSSIRQLNSHKKEEENVDIDEKPDIALINTSSSSINFTTSEGPITSESKCLALKNEPHQNENDAIMKTEELDPETEAPLTPEDVPNEMKNFLKTMNDLMMEQQNVMRELNNKGSIPNPNPHSISNTASAPQSTPPLTSSTPPKFPSTSSASTTSIKNFLKYIQVYTASLKSPHLGKLTEKLENKINKLESNDETIPHDRLQTALESFISMITPN